MKPTRYPCPALRHELHPVPTQPAEPCPVALQWWLAWRFQQALRDHFNDALVPARHQVNASRVQVLASLLRHTGVRLDKDHPGMPWMGELREFDEQEKPERDGQLAAALKTPWAVYLFHHCTTAIVRMAMEDDGADHNTSGLCLATNAVAVEINRAWEGYGITLDV